MGWGFGLGIGHRSEQYTPTKIKRLSDSDEREVYLVFCHNAVPSGCIGTKFHTEAWTKSISGDAQRGTSHRLPRLPAAPVMPSRYPGSPTPASPATSPMPWAMGCFKVSSIGSGAYQPSRWTSWETPSAYGGHVTGQGIQPSPSHHGGLPSLPVRVHQRLAPPQAVTPGQASPPPQVGCVQLRLSSGELFMSPE